MRVNWLKRIGYKLLPVLTIAVVLAAVVLPAFPIQASPAMEDGYVIQTHWTIKDDGVTLTKQAFADGDPYYWAPVAGSGTGNWTDVAHWSSTNDGTGGDYATPPNPTNNVFFASTAFTGAGQVVTVDAAASCLAMDWTGATNTPTLAGSSALTIYGDLTFIAAMVQTYSGTLSLLSTSASAKFTTALPLSCTVKNNSTGQYTMQDALVTTGGFQWYGTHLTTGNFNITCASFLGYSQFRAVTFTLGSSIINCTAFTITVTDTFTVDVNTSTINVTGTGAVALGNANYDGADFNLNGTAHTVSGSPTGIAVLTRNGTAANTNSITLTSGTTLTCTTFAMIGNSRANQLLVQSSTLGSPATITTTNWTGTTNVDLMDITATNAVDFSAAGLNILTIGNAGGNTGITFPATLGTATYADAGDHKASTAANWDIGRIPLVGIDDVTIGATITYDMPRMGKSITFTGTPTVSLSNDVSNYGSLTLVAGMTYTHNSKINYLLGRGNYNLTTNGISVYKYTIQAPTGKITFQDNIVSVSLFAFRGGEIDADNKNLTFSGFVCDTGTRILNMRSGIFTSTGGGANAWNIFATGLTFDAGTSTIVINHSDATASTFGGAGLTYNNVTVQGAGAYALTITGNNVFNTFKSDDSVANKTIIGTGTTQTVNDFTKDNGGTGVTTITNGTWTKYGRLANGGGTFTGSPVYFDNISESIACTVTGTATVTLPHGVTGTATSGVGGAVVTDSPKALVAGVNTITVTAGGDNLFTIDTTSVDATPIALDYMLVTGSTAQPANVWYAGSHGFDGGGNTQWLFIDPALTTTTQAATGITMDKDGVTGGTFNGTVTTDLDGTPTIGTLFNYGLTVAYGSSTAAATMYDNGTFTGTVPAALTPGATYHFRGVSTNGNAGSPFNGADSTFVFTMPTVVTGDAITTVLHGSITDMGVAATTYCYFKWGYTALTMTNLTSLQTLAASGNFSQDMKGVTDPLKTVYFAAVSTNGVISTQGDTKIYIAPRAVDDMPGTEEVMLLFPVLILLSTIGVATFIGYKSLKNQDYKMVIASLVLVVLLLIFAGIAISFINQARSVIP